MEVKCCARLLHARSKVQGRYTVLRPYCETAAREPGGHHSHRAGQSMRELHNDVTGRQVKCVRVATGGPVYRLIVSSYLI